MSIESTARSAVGLPDLTASLPRAGFEFSQAAGAEAAAVLAAGPDALFRRLLRDQESEAALLVARRVLDAFCGDPDGEDLPADADAIAARVDAVRDELAATVAALRARDPKTREAVLRQRAPLGLLSGCWLDTLSQPATQPSVIVNRLFAHHFLLKGDGNPQRAVHHVRRRGLEAAGVYLPEIEAAEFLREAHARPLTALHGAFYLALSRLPANFLPEVVGVHYAVHALAVDDHLAGATPPLAEQALREVLAEYLVLAGAEERRRLLAAIRGTLDLEREHVAMLTELADWQDGLSLDARVAAIVARHAPYAGRQHRSVRIGDRLLSDALDEENLDLAAFVQELRDSRQLRPGRDGEPRFLRALKFGGPMFGIFDEHEAATFKAWADAANAGELPPVEIPTNRVGDEPAGRWSAALAASQPADVRFAEARPEGDRQLFHRLVNIENHANTLPLARERAARGFADAEILFTHGAAGWYTDASWFDYTAEALLERVEAIYWDKLVNPYRPLEEVPDRDEVIFGQKTFALGSLIDGAWAYRIGNLGRFQRRSDGMLFSIYADEMGRGDIRKNHITLIYQVLGSMGISLPHIRDEAFLDQDELPDGLYGFSIHQLSMALFPDTLYNEILGYNLGIEMFGLGELRLHEMQKLRRHGFDVSYEQAHLSIDNVSAGHARQSAEIIVSYLDGVARNSGASAAQDEWRRIWRGYASFAYFVEHELVNTLGAAEPEVAELVI